MLWLHTAFPVTKYSIVQRWVQSCAKCSLAKKCEAWRKHIFFWYLQKHFAKYFKDQAKHTHTHTHVTNAATASTACSTLLPHKTDQSSDTYFFQITRGTVCSKWCHLFLTCNLKIGIIIYSIHSGLTLFLPDRETL